MITILKNEILDGILTFDADAALKVLRKNRLMFLDSIEGPLFHAEVLYCAIKHADPRVVQYICSLPVHSSIAFFKFCGHSPLSFALAENRQDLTPILLKDTDRNFALHIAVKLHQDNVKTLLLQKNSANQKLLKYLGL